MSDLQAYLASNYLSGAKAEAILSRNTTIDPTKKRKKRKLDPSNPLTSNSSSASLASTREPQGLIIADDDDDQLLRWNGRRKGRAEDDDEDEMTPVVEDKRGQFKAKGPSATTWSTVREADPSLRPAPPPLSNEETSAQGAELGDDAPVVVATIEDPASSSNSTLVARGGLQSAADLKAEQGRRQAEQQAKKREAEIELADRRRAMRERGEDDEDEMDDPTATVYRDASGRRIDIKLQKAEQAKAKREELERELKKMEWGKGLVQKEDKEREKREKEAIKFKPLARYADDEELNEDLRDKDRWNDPAAAFLTVSSPCSPFVVIFVSLSASDHRSVLRPFDSLLTPFSSL
jgi:pre-mRNA-splicing factor CWC26